MGTDAKTSRKGKSRLKTVGYGLVLGLVVGGLGGLAVGVLLGILMQSVFIGMAIGSTGGVLLGTVITPHRPEKRSQSRERIYS